jgi:hypothetical protein
LSCPLYTCLLESVKPRDLSLPTSKKLQQF